MTLEASSPFGPPPNRFGMSLEASSTFGPPPNRFLYKPCFLCAKCVSIAFRKDRFVHFIYSCLILSLILFNFVVDFVSVVIFVFFLIFSIYTQIWTLSLLNVIERWSGEVLVNWKDGWWWRKRIRSERGWWSLYNASLFSTSFTIFLSSNIIFSKFPIYLSLRQIYFGSYQ